MENLDVRIDKWLWMVRLFKTRSMATDACNAGKVKMNGINVKPSKTVKSDECFHVRIGQLEKVVQVISTPKNRVGAALVPQYYTDLTSPEEYERIKQLHTKFEYRDHGVGRPTKRDRRQIDYLKDYYHEATDGLKTLLLIVVLTFLSVMGAVGQNVPSSYDTLRLCNSILPTQYNTVMITEAGDYMIHYTSSTGSDSLVQLHVIVYPNPVPTIMGNTAHCVNMPATVWVDNTLYASYLWSTGANTYYTSVYGTSCTVYVTDQHGCFGSNSTNFEILPDPVIAATGTTQLCPNDSTVLHATGGSVYYWFNAHGGVISYDDSLLYVATQSGVIDSITLKGYSPMGCFSQTTVHITVFPQSESYDTVSLCANELPYYVGDSVITEAGDYTFHFWSQYACDSVIYLHLIVNQNPEVSISGNSSFCPGGSTSLYANTNADFYWNTGSTSPVINVSEIGWYVLTAEDANGCISSDSVEVSYISQPIAIVSGDLSFCEGQSTVLTASGGESYVWKNAFGITISQEPEVIVSESGLYMVTLTDSNGCIASTQVTAMKKNLPNVFLFVSSEEICEGEQVILQAGYASGYTYLWSTGSTDRQITVNTGGTYVLQVTSNGCTASDSVQITSHPLPVVVITGCHQLCRGNSCMLSANEGESYIWSTGETTQSITVSPNQTTLYSVTVTDSNGCSSSDNFSVHVDEMFQLVISGGDGFCDGDSLQLYASGWDNLIWSTGQHGNSIVVYETGDYTVDAEGDVPCVMSATQHVEEVYPPEVNIEGPSSACQGDTLTLSAIASQEVSCLWNTGLTTQSIRVTEGGIYSVIVSNSYGCVNDTSKLITLNPIPSVTIQGPSTVCEGSSLTLVAVGDATSYEWSTGEIGTEITCYPTASGNYQVTAFNAFGCSATATLFVEIKESYETSVNVSCCSDELPYMYNGVAYTQSGSYEVHLTSVYGCDSLVHLNLTVNQNPEVAISGNTGICPGESTILFATSNAVYHWNTGSTLPYINVSDTGWYVLTAEATNGCVSKDSAYVSYLSQPVASVSGDLSFCDGQNTLLTASGGESYVWRNAFGMVISQEAEVLVSETGAYMVMVTDSNGCTASNQVTVIKKGLPFIDIIASDNNVCEGTNVTLSTGWSSGYSYLWSTGATERQITIDAPGTYILYVTANGCTAIDSAIISMYPRPVISFIGDTLFCEGDTVSSTTIYAVAPDAISYLWSTGSTEQSITVSSTQTMNYWVDIENVYGCQNRDTVNVSYSQAPNVRIEGNPRLCAGDSTILTARGAATYLWSNGSTDTSIVVGASGVYSLEGWDVHGCYGQDSIEVNNYGMPTVQIVGNPSGCSDDVNLLTALSPSAVAYLWNTGDTTYQIRAQETAVYSVTVSDSNGCQASASFSFELRPSPTCSIEGNTEICSGDTTTLTASGGQSYFWSTGEITPSISVSPATTSSYSLVIMDINGCTSSASVQVIVHATTPIVINGPSDFCDGDSVLLVAEDSGNLIWSTGQYGDSIVVYETGDYMVWSLDSDACQKSSMKHVEKHFAPEVQIEGASYVCGGDTAFLYAVTQVPVSYQWTTGSTESVIPVTSTNVYGVMVTDMYGCTNDTSKLVMAYSAPTVVINGPSSVCYGESAVLSVEGNAVRYQWSTGDTTSTITVSPLYATVYYVVAYSSNGCSATASHFMSVSSTPVASITGDTIICEGETTVLTSSNASSFLWSTGATSRSISVSEEGVYSVVVSNTAGCTNSSSVYVHVNNRPNLMVLGDTTICQGEQTELLAIGGDTYLWSNGATSPNIVVSPEISTSYTVQASNGVCTSEMTRLVVVNENPEAVIIAPNGICDGSSAIMMAQGGDAYLWSTGQTNAQIEVHSSGVYQLVAFSTNGCTDTVSHTLELYPTPQLSIYGDTALCPNEQGVLTAIGTGSYLWNTGDTSASITVTAPTYYQVQLTDLNGCVATANQFVMTLVSPTIVIYGATDMCDNDTINLTAFCTNTSSFVWSTGEISNTIAVSPSETTNYIVTAVSAANCMSQQSHTVAVHPSYSAEFSAEICVGQSYSGQGFNIPVQNEAGEFDYTITLQTVYGCDSVKTLHLTVNPRPVITGTISGNTQPTSLGNYVYMIDPVENATSYEWIQSNPNWSITYNQTVAQISVTSPGIATLSVYALNECGQSLPVSIQITYGTGIEGVEMTNVIVYPNPTRGVVNIKYSMSDGRLFNDKVQLLDMYGKLLVEWTMSGDNMQLDMSQYAAGVYLLKLRNTQNATESVVKVVRE